MHTTAQQYEAASRSLAALLEGVPPDRWTDPSACAGWSAGDVLGHLVRTQREFPTGHGVDLGPAPDVAADPAAAWRDHAKRVGEAIADEELDGRECDGHFGRTTIGATVGQFHVRDMVVHRWDIARAGGAEALLSDDELDRMEDGADSFRVALYMEGICPPGPDVPDDADRQVRVLARLGRST